MSIVRTVVHFIFLFVFIGLTFFGCSDEDYEPRRIVCLHADGEHYKAFAWLLCSHLKSKLDDSYEVIVSQNPARDLSKSENSYIDYELTGAMDIIDAIARNNDETTFLLGLTQADVAYYFRHGGHSLYEFPHLRNERVVAFARIFPEYLHLYSSVTPKDEDTGFVQKKNHEEMSFDDFEELWEKLYLGSLGSGTLITTINLFPVLSERPLYLPRDGLHQSREFLPSPDLAPANAWGGTYVAGAQSKRIQELLDRVGGSIISLKPEQQRHLTNVLSTLYHVGDLEYKMADGRTTTARTVEIPTILVGSNRLPHEVAFQIRDILEYIDGDGELSDVLSPFSGEAPEEIDYGTIDQVVKTMSRYRIERYSDLILPAHRRIGDLYNDNYRWPLFIALVSTFLLIFMVWFLLKSRKPGSNWLEFSLIKIIVASVSFALAWFSFALVFVVLMEYWSFITYRVETASPFITERFTVLIPRIFYYVSSGFSDDVLFPSARLSQIAWISIPFAIALTLLIGTARTLIPQIAIFMENIQERKVDMVLEGHIVICNWHPHLEEVIRMLCDQARIEGRRQEKVVVVAHDPDEIMVPRLGQMRHNVIGECLEFAIPPRVGESEENFSKFIVVRGNVQEKVILQSIRVSTAKTIIVFPRKGHPEPDSVSLMLVLNIRKEIERLELEGHSVPRVIVWCEDPKNVDLFLDPKLGLTDVCSAEWAWRMICQATHVEHVTDIYRRLMTSTADSNEIYELQLGNDWERTKFGELQRRADRYNREYAPPLTSKGTTKLNTILLLGYSRPSERKPLFETHHNGDFLLGQNWESRRQDGLHLNPNPDEEIIAGDRLLVITYSFNQDRKSQLLEALKIPLETSGSGLLPD